MKVVLIGGGGREHALALKLQQSSQVDEIVAIPGGSGMRGAAESLPVTWSNAEELADIIEKQQPDLVIVGNEAPLVQGIVDVLTARGIAAFGPTKAAARIESSKVFAKELMKKYDIPTAGFASFTHPARAKTYLVRKPAPFVIKADGLAQGKGVIIAKDNADAQAAIDVMLRDRKFGNAGSRIVIEEFMEGREVSLLAFVDGETVVPLIPAQDYKRLGDNNEGPNTGGMGAIAPVSMSDEEYQAAVERILKPTARALVAEGCPFRGVLYAGLMLTADGPKVVEFNCRFGDPEAQVLLPLMENDLGEVLQQIMDGHLADVQLRWRDGAAVCVVLASFGYPQQVYKGDRIKGLDKVTAYPDVHLCHAATRLLDDVYCTDGGRVLDVVAVRESIAAAKHAAYDAVGKIEFEGMQYRTDIAADELERLSR